MWYTLLLLTLALANGVSARPLEEDQNKHDATELQQQFDLVAYVENFKQVMAEYVKSRYNHLTVDEVEKVKTILEKFLKDFTDDLRAIINGGEIEKFDEKEKIEDGISDATFEDINRKVKEQFTDVGEETTKEIVYRLRKHLLSTRQKLDQVIEESKRAHEENS